MVTSMFILLQRVGVHNGREAWPDGRSRRLGDCIFLPQTGSRVGGDQEGNGQDCKPSNATSLARLHLLKVTHTTAPPTGTKCLNA